ncbi:MAG: hypothetical protein ACR652_07805 [Methylocystis sp.]|uniref:hypothetical protein n=1 Tax=Methylocystis sp. TaxID=1911079 RepID=UPI003DA2B24F
MLNSWMLAIAQARTLFVESNIGRGRFKNVSSPVDFWFRYAIAAPVFSRFEHFRFARDNLSDYRASGTADADTTFQGGI